MQATRLCGDAIGAYADEALAGRLTCGFSFPGGPEVTDADRLRRVRGRRAR
jgi:hypothetical protein